MGVTNHLLSGMILQVPSLKLTAFRTWKLMVGRCFPFGFWPIFRGELLVSGSVSPPTHKALVKCSSVPGLGQKCLTHMMEVFVRKTVSWHIYRSMDISAMEIIHASYKTLLEHLLYDFHCETRKTAQWIFLASASSDFIHIPYTSRVLSSDRLADHVGKLEARCCMAIHQVSLTKQLWAACCQRTFALSARLTAAVPQLELQRREWYLEDGLPGRVHVRS